MKRNDCLAVNNLGSRLTRHLAKFRIGKVVKFFGFGSFGRLMHSMSFDPFVMALFKKAQQFVICYFLIVSSLEESIMRALLLLSSFFNKYFLHLWHFMIFARLKQKQTRQINDKTQPRKKKWSRRMIYTNAYFVLGCFCGVFFSSSVYDERHRIIAHSLTVDVMCVCVCFLLSFFSYYLFRFAEKTLMHLSQWCLEFRCD